MTLSGTFGAFFFKKTVAKFDKKNIFKILLDIYLYLGLFCYVLGAVLNIILLRYIDYTVLYPMTSITYLWTIIFSYPLLNEKITKNKVIAVPFIIIGVFLISS